MSERIYLPVIEECDENNNVTEVHFYLYGDKLPTLCIKLMSEVECYLEEGVDDEYVRKYSDERLKAMDRTDVEGDNIGITFIDGEGDNRFTAQEVLELIAVRGVKDQTDSIRLCW